MATETTNTLTDAYDAATAAGTAAEAAPATARVTTPSMTSANTTQERVNEINRMYDAQQQARQNELQTAYDISRSEMQAAADKIAPQFQTQANANAVDWERQRRNFLEGANMNGINTGAGAQAQLAMMGQQQRTQNNIRTAQASAQAEADRQMANLTAQYQSDIRAALANNDYQRAAALLDEYNSGYQRDLAAAEVLAGYGDFSGYANVYGDETAAGMADIWAQQNPDVAYIVGRITKDQRDNIKSRRPINDGLDENGVRIRRSGGGGGGEALSDSLRNQEWQMYHSALAEAASSGATPPPAPNPQYNF